MVVPKQPTRAVDQVFDSTTFHWDDLHKHNGKFINEVNAVLQKHHDKVVETLEFRGFPNLRKLHLRTLHVNRKDLEHVLSRCCNLEWLRIDRCDLNDELTVDGPLSRLLYLSVECCIVTKIKFHAVNLATFEYDGPFIPIDLTHSLKLRSANIELDNAVFQHALTSLLNGLPSVQNLTLNIDWQYLEKQWLWDNPLKFSNLRHLQLFMLILPDDVDKFAGHALWLAEAGPYRKEIGQCKYEYLKDIYITGFKAARGKLEFLLHIVENAPALEVISVKIGDHSCKKFWPYEGSGPSFEEAKRIARTCLNPAECKV